MDDSPENRPAVPMIMIMVHFNLEVKTLYGSFTSIRPTNNLFMDAGRDDIGLVTAELEGEDCSDVMVESNCSITMGDFFSMIWATDFERQ